MAQTGRLIQRNRRLGVRVNARISTLDPVRDGITGERYFRISEETCANLSQGGAFVSTHQPLQQGCRLMLELDLPDGEVLQTIGRVVWSRSEIATPGVPARSTSTSTSGIGVAFTSAAPQHAERLERYLAKHLPSARAAKRRTRPAQPGTSL